MDEISHPTAPIRWLDIRLKIFHLPFTGPNGWNRDQYISLLINSSIKFKPGVPGGVLIVEWEMSGLLLLPKTFWTQIKETSHCIVECQGLQNVSCLSLF